MPHAFVLELQPDRPAPPPRQLPRFAHGLFFHLLQTISPELSAALHAAPRKPFTLGARALPDRLELRVTTLDDALFSPLLGAVVRESLAGLALGQDTYRVARVLATPEGHPRAGFMSWPELEAVAPRASVALEFLSPTTFSTSKSDGRERHTPLPDPRLVFSSLLRSYQAFAPRPHDPATLAALLELIDLELVLTRLTGLSTQPHPTGKVELAGFTGRAVFRVLSDSLPLKTHFARWAALAPYAGVGAKTPYGMGQVRVLEERPS